VSPLLSHEVSVNHTHNTTNHSDVDNQEREVATAHFDESRVRLALHNHSLLAFILDYLTKERPFCVKLSRKVPELVRYLALCELFVNFIIFRGLFWLLRT